MANIHETIAEVEKLNPDLAKQIKRYVKDHSYGLVFEQNLPDSVRLWTKKPVKDDTVHILPPRGKFDTAENYKEWHVSDIVDGIATLKCDEEVKFVSVEDIVPVVGHKGVIYPGLKVIDKVERGNLDDPYHVLINAENYHALEMLRYAYAGKVDCIYIDPPYNKPDSQTWKYNCNYVDGNDDYRHSKWLSMMERRLRLARDLLNPENSVLIVTIDEEEYLRLGLLLEQLFPTARISMISTVIKSGTSMRQIDFSRCNEYIFYLMFGKAIVEKEIPQATNVDIPWRSLIRGGTGSNNFRKGFSNSFYPIFINNITGKIDFIGSPLDENKHFKDINCPLNCSVLLPIKKDGTEMLWGVSSSTLKEYVKKGYVKVVKNHKNNSFNIKYITTGVIKDIVNGKILVSGIGNDGSIEGSYVSGKPQMPQNQWNNLSHNATHYGTDLLKLFIGERFTYPKSLYAVEDCLNHVLKNKPNALIVDFFAGSGTTAHATMLLNHLDGGHRRCICVTNNEIGPDNEKALTKQGLRPTDKEWQDIGIANYITWERIKAAITGIATNGEPVKGEYKFNEEFPMSEGFKENAVFCELTYESHWDIRLDRAFNAVALILWMLAGCKGKVIKKLSDAYAITDNYAVLFKYDAVNKFAEMVKSKPSIKHIFVVTDDQQRYLEVLKRINWINPKNVHRLYESYLKSFEILGEGGLD